MSDKTIMSLPEIARRIKMDNISRVCRDTNLSRPTVYSVRDQNEGVRYDTVKKLSDYYREIAEVFQV